jgi:diguanylate cyclase (GGDEF)-like protein
VTGTSEAKAATPATGDDFSCSLTAVLLSRVRRFSGEEGVARLLKLASSPHSTEYLEDIGNWVSHDEAIALWEAGTEITGDPDFARHVGEDFVGLLGASSNATVLRALGSPEKLLQHMADAAHRFSSVAELETIDVGPGYAEVRAVAAEGFSRHQLHCDWTAGLLTQVTVLFGLAPAAVQHEICQAKGDTDCRYLLNWQTGADHEIDPAEQVASLKSQLDAMSGRLQSVFATAADLIASGDLEQTLARITERAALQVRAPRYLLAVRPTETSVQWHQRGLSEEECQQVAQRVLAEDPEPYPEHWLVVPVSSHRNHYGSLVAMHQPGATFFPQERQILEVYARYAAAALDSAAALAEANARQQEAQRRFEESRALLELARRLATADESGEIARRLAEAVPAVIDCDRVAVFIWEEAEGELVRRAVSGPASQADASGLDRIRPADVPELAQLLKSPNPEPLVIDLADSPLLGALQELGVVHCLAVPIATAERLLGCLIVSVLEHPERLGLSPELRDRLSGVAAHAVTALENGRLVDHITHQASHDPLTGVCNRVGFSEKLSLVTDQAQRTGAPVGLFYVDLDEFKQVNDRHGHVVGDQLLRAVADRLSELVRPSDTVARLGGDEFAVLIEEIDADPDINLIGKRLHSAFDEPFSAAGQTFDLTASIGRAVWPSEVGELETLLRQADAAMYEVKRTRQPA